MVLVDPQDLPASDAATPKPAPKPGKTSLPVLMARIGVMRLLAGPLGSIQNLPAGDKQAYKASTVTPRSTQTFLDEGMGMSEGGAQARAVTTLGALPLIVLSRGKDQDAELGRLAGTATSSYRRTASSSLQTIAVTAS